MTSRNPEATCGNCPYAVGSKEEGVGFCRRNPPVVSLSGQGVYPIVTSADLACGEHPAFWVPGVKEAAPHPGPDVTKMAIPEGKTSMGRDKRLLDDLGHAGQALLRDVQTGQHSEVTND